MVKKIAIGVIIFLVLVIGFVLLVPVLFKEELKAKVEKVASEQVEAKVQFADFDISLLKHFPKISVGLSNIEIINEAPFEGDTLLSAQDFEIALNFWSVFSDKVEVHSVYAERPSVFVHVLRDGRANYDIYKDNSESTESPSDTSAFEIGLEKWQITDGKIRYQDDTLKLLAIVEGLQHEGSGNIKAEQYDLSTQTSIQDLYVVFDEIAYIDHRPVSADATLDMNMATMKFAFKENELKINDLPISLNGWVQMPENSDAIDMDLSFSAAKSSFKELLSLIPPEFLKDYKGLEAKGDFEFDGSVKGSLDTEQGVYPSFNTKLLVKNGHFKYADLPTAIDNINVDMRVLNTTSTLENTTIDIKAFNLNLGNNPINGKVIVKGLEKYDVDANINAKVDLAQLQQVYPIDSLELKGIYNLRLLAKGTYDEATKRIPTIDADMTLKNGYVKSLAYPVPIENLEVEAHAKNQTGRMEDMKVDLEKITMQIEDKPFSVTGHTRGVENLVYDLAIRGELDLEKITKIFPLDGMSLKGNIKADIDTKGSTAALETEQYEQLPTSGDLEVQNLDFVSQDLPQGMKITNAKVRFTPQQMILESFKGFLGESDIALTGGLTNYLAYALAMAELKAGNPTLMGNMNMTSKNFNVNEWMNSTDDPTTVEDETGVVDVPKDIDFTFNASIDKVKYDNLSLDNMRGIVRVNNGEVRMDNLTFGAVGGKFRASGSYDSRDLSRPLFAFNMDIVEANLAEAFKSFNTVQAFAPLAQHLEGKFSLNGFNVAGIMKSDMTPDMNTLTGGGVMQIVDAVMKENPSINKMASLLQMPQLKSARLKDVMMKTQIENGKMNIEPFDLNLLGYKAKAGGTTSFDGNLDFKAEIDIPKEEALSLISNFVKIDPSEIENEQIPLLFNIEGLYDSPKVSLDNSAIKAQIKQKAKDKLVDTAGNLLEDFFGNKSKPDSVQNNPTADSLQTTKSDSTKVKKKDPVEEAKKKLKNKLKGFGIGG